MRKAAAIVLVLMAGCSTAPVAGLLDWLQPGGFHSDHQRGAGGERLPAITVDPLVGPNTMTPVIPGPPPGPQREPGSRISPPVLEPPAPDAIPGGTSRTNLSGRAALEGARRPDR